MIIKTVKELKEFLKNIPDDAIIPTLDDEGDIVYNQTEFDYRPLEKELVIYRDDFYEHKYR